MPIQTPPTAILGGAFDPVTVGHVRLVRLVEERGFAVACMPCGDRHAFDKVMLPAEQRIEMLRLALGSTAICRTEIEHGTYRAADTNPLLVAQYGGPVHWIIGTDNANGLDRWHDGERLKAEIPFIVAARKGHALGPDGAWCLKAPHRFIPDGDLPETASTEARAAIAAGDWDRARLLIPGPVLDLIRLRGWYQGSSTSS